MNVNNLKKDTIYVLTKDFIVNNNDLNGILAVFNKDDEDTLIDPIIYEVQNSENKLTFQVSASSEKWKSTYNPENLYLADGKIFSANFADSIERERNEDNQDIITVIAYERQKLLEREFVRAWNSTTGFENIDDFMVVVVSGGNLTLVNNGNAVTTTHTKGTSGYVLDALLFGTGWTTGICDVEGTFDLETDQMSIYENIMQVQEIWGGILVFDSLNKIVHHRDETTWLPYSGYEVRYQKNLQSSKYIGDNKIITYLCPLGEGGLNIKSVNSNSLWLIDTTYTNTVLRGIENNDNIYEAEQLKRWGQRKLQDLCKPRRELTMTTALLNSVEGYEYETVGLNDIVDVIDFEFVEDRVTQLRVIEYKHYLWSGADAELVIGDITLESTDIFKKTAKATNLINNGTLDTTKVVDYYKNGQSLRKTLKQIDQTIVDTKTELELADDGLSARITQTNTRVDNLNNDVVSQDQKITQLILDVDGLESTVSTIADLTETRTSYNGYIELENAMEGYLLGISIHGYDGSFVPTYLSQDTILNEDLYLLGNTVSFLTYTKNNVPTKTEYYEMGNINSSTGKNTSSNNYLRSINLIKVEPSAEMYFSLNNSHFAFGDVYFYAKYGEYITSWNTLYNEDVIENLSGKAIEIPSTAYYIRYTIKEKVVLNNRSVSNSNVDIDDYSYIPYNNSSEEDPELELAPASIPGIKPQLEYGTEKTEFVDFNTKRYEFELDDELRQILIDEEDIASSDTEDYVLGLYNTSTGELSEDSSSSGRFTNKELIEVFSGEHLHITLNTDYKMTSICFYDKDEEFLGTQATLYGINMYDYENNFEFNILSQIKYMVINIAINDSITPTLADMVSSADLEILATNNIVFDEFTIVEKNAMLIRRIGVDGQGNKYVLTNPEYHDYGEIEITTVTGLNILQVDYWTPTVIVEYGIKSKYTDMFATKVELSTQIKQTDEYILLTASKKVSKDELIEEFNSQILVTAERLLIQSNKIRIASTYGTWDYDGTLTATRGYIAGWQITDDVLKKGLAGIRAVDTDETQSLKNVIYVGDGLGKDGNPSFAVNTIGDIRGNSINLYALSQADRYPSIIKLWSAAEQVGTLITADTVQTGHVIAGDGVAQGYCMHSPDIDIDPTAVNTYFVHYTGSNLVFNMNATKTTNFNVSGYWISNGSSDERLKHNIGNLNENLLKAINEIEIKQFRFNNDKENKLKTGIIAQELLKICEKYDINIFDYDIVKYGIKYPNDENEYYAVDYTQLLLIKTKILEEKNKNLEERLSKIEEMLNSNSQ